MDSPTPGAMAEATGDVVKEETNRLNNEVSGTMAESTGVIKVETNRLNNEDYSNEEQIEVVEVEQACREKTRDDQPVELDHRQLNILIQQLKKLCSKKLSDASTSQKNQSPSISDENNVTQYYCKCGSLQQTRKRSSDHTNYVLTSKKDRKRKIDEEDADLLFFYSILPYVKNIPECNKLEWQIQCLTLFKRYGY